MTWQTGARVIRATNPDTVPERGTVLDSNRSMTTVQWDDSIVPFSEFKPGGPLPLVTTIPNGSLKPA